MRYLSLFLLLTSSTVFSESNVTGVLKSTGDMAILIVDKPSEPPDDAAMIWSGSLVRDPEVLSKINDINLSLANSKLLFTMDHSQKAHPFTTSLAI